MEFRLKKIEKLYLQEISNLLVKDIKDPLLSEVRVTYVKVSPDLRLAKVYFVLQFGKSKFVQVIKGLKRSKGYLKKKLAEHIQLKYTPELEFFYDDDEEKINRVDELFRQLDDEKQLPN